MNDQKASCEESPKSESVDEKLVDEKSVDENIDNDNKLSNTNNCQEDSQEDIQTSVDSVKQKRHQYSKVTFYLIIISNILYIYLNFCQF